MASTPARDESKHSGLQDLVSQIQNGFSTNVDGWPPLGDFQNYSDKSINYNYQSLRALYTLNNIISAFSPTNDEYELVKTICQAISDSGGYKAAVFTRRGANRNTPFDLITASGISLIKLTDITNAHNPNHQKAMLVTSKAVATGETQITGDILADPKLACFHNIASTEGINSAAAMPILGQDFEMLGCLTIYAAEKNAFGGSELAILGNACKIISQFIIAARSHGLNHLIAKAVDKTTDGVAVLDHKGEIIFANQAALTITRFEKQDLVGCHVSIIAPEGTDNLPPELQAAIDNMGSWTGRWTAARKTGDNFIADVDVSTITDKTSGAVYHFLVFSDATAKLARQSRLNQRKPDAELSNNNINITNNDLNIGNDSINPDLGQATFSTQTGKKQARADHISRESMHGSETILLVDDEPDLVDALTMLLTSLGYQVVGKTSSVSALRDFKSSPDIFDIVITDMTMPGMMGDELISNILKVRPEIPVILCSGLYDYGDFKLPKGNVTIIDKPSRISAISAAIRKSLGN